jgi:hypothetical protein
MFRRSFRLFPAKNGVGIIEMPRFSNSVLSG